MNADPEPNLNELEWTAFRYVAGELTADEARAFEAQLAVDQGVREAMSRAANLALDVSAAGRGVVELRRDPPPTERWGRRVAQAAMWAAVGVAATLAVWIGSNRRENSPGDPPNGPIVVQQTTPSTDVNALAWLQLRNLNDATLQVEHELETSEPEIPLAAETDNSPVVPSWIVDLNKAAPGGSKP